MSSNLSPDRITVRVVGQQMRADRETERAVVAVLDAFNAALRDRDLEAIVALFVPDADVTLVGSDAGETAIGPLDLRSFFERIFARAGTFNFDWHSCTVSARGEVAWFFGVGTARYTEHDHVTTVSYRTTAILEQRQDQWLFVHYHGSEPVGA